MGTPIGTIPAVWHGGVPNAIDAEADLFNAITGFPQCQHGLGR